jgi:hypothetical protein
VTPPYGFDMEHRKARTRLSGLKRDLIALWKAGKIRESLYRAELRSIEDQEWDLAWRRCTIEGCQNLGRKNPGGSRQPLCERHRNEKLAWEKYE